MCRSIHSLGTRMSVVFNIIYNLIFKEKKYTFLCVTMTSHNSFRQVFKPCLYGGCGGVSGYEVGDGMVSVPSPMLMGGPRYFESLD